MSALAELDKRLGRASAVRKEGFMVVEKNTVTEQNKAIVRRWLEEVWNQRKAESLDELAAGEFVLRWFPMPSPVYLQDYRQLRTVFLAAFPDFNVEIDDLIAEDDKVTARFTQRCTHQGEFMGIPPSGQRVEKRALAIYRIEKSKIAEIWAAETPWTMTLTQLSSSG